MRLPDRFDRMRSQCRQKACGSRVKYLAGCRCIQCRAANSRYETERSQARKEGDWNGYVPADKAREWLRHLSKLGIGRRSVSIACDVADSTLCEIARGKKEKIRARTERRILAVDTGARAPGDRIPAAKTWRRIDELVDLGYSKRWLARKLGMGNAIQISRSRIRLSTSIRVERFYNLVRAGKVAR